MVSWPLALIALFVETLILSLILTPLSRKMGIALGMVDQPGERKIHAAPIPRSGGIAIFASFLGALLINLLAAWLLRGWLEERIPHVVNIPSKLGELLAVMLGGAWIFAVGVVDDRVTLRPRVKLICQLLATVPLLIAGIHLTGFLPPLVGMALTVFWVALLINSFNFLDNMDGLSAGIAAICCTVFAWIAGDSHQWFIAAMFLMLAGSLLGFLYYNFNPASIFMGDGGSMFIGYMIAVMAVLTTYYEQGLPTGFPVLMPVVVLGVPIFDTVSVCWIRWRAGRPLSQGDTNHFSHRMTALGMSRRGAVLFIYLVTGCVGLSALPLRSLDLASASVYSLQIILWFVIIYTIERLGQNNRDH